MWVADGHYFVSYGAAMASCGWLGMVQSNYMWEIIYHSCGRDEQFREEDDLLTIERAEQRGTYTKDYSPGHYGIHDTTLNQLTRGEELQVLH